jgi:hypothetical protein
VLPGQSVVMLRADRVFSNQSTEQEFPRGSAGLADQFPLVDGGQFLDLRFHLASFRLIRADELDEQQARRIGTSVARAGAGDVLCVAHSHISGDPGIDRSAAAKDE